MKSYEEKPLQDLTQEEISLLAEDLLQEFGGPEQVKEYLDLLNALLVSNTEISVIFSYIAAEYLKRTGKKKAPVEEVFAFLGSLPENEVDEITARITRDIAKIRGREKQRGAVSAIPNAAAVHFLLRVLNNLKNDRTPQPSKNNRHEQITTSVSKGSAIFTRESGGTVTTVKIKQAADIMRKTGKTFAKVLAFTLQEMNRQNFPRELEINLQDLVRPGAYSSKSNAKRAVIDFFDQQLNIEIGGKVKKGKRTITEEGGVMFYHWKATTPGHIVFSINPKFNWEFVASFFSVLPEFTFSLPGNAFLLAWYIFFLARQNADAIREKGTFTVGLESVREYLGLPDPAQVKNRKYRQYIIEPIEEAIEAIEEKLQTVPEAQGQAFTITPYGTETTNISDFLHGYLEIGLSGTFAQSFIDISEEAERSRKKWEAVKLKEAAKLQAIEDRKEAKEN